MVVTVVVYGPRGEKVEIDLCDTEEQFKSITVLQLKEKIKERLPICQSVKVRLIFIDKSLHEDSSLLSAYGIKHKSDIHVVVQLLGGSFEPGKPVLQVFVRGSRGEKMMIDLCDTEEQFKSITVLQLKEKILERFDYRDIRAEGIRLIWQGKELGEHSLLGEDSLLSAYGIPHMSTIDAVQHLRGGGLVSGKGDGGMGDKGGKNRSKEKLFSF